MTRFKQIISKAKRRYLAHKHWLLPLTLTLLITTLTITFLLGLNSSVKAPKLKNGKGDVLYSVSNSVFSSTIGTKQGEPKITYTVGDSQAGFVLAGASLSIPVKENDQTVRFPAVLPDVDLRYTTTANGIKEELIINQYNKNISNTYLFDLNLAGLVPKKLANDFIAPTFRDHEGKYQFHFEKPFAIDANGVRTDNVLLQISEDKQLPGKYSMKLIVDPKWLADPARAYPIIIDPTIVHDTTAEFASGYFDRVRDVGSGSNPQIASYYQELSADEHAIGLWRMNEASGNALDSSSYGNTGTPTGTTVVPGLFGNARDFNGSSDYITTTEGSEFSHNTYTVEAWVNQSADNAAIRFITDNRDASSDGTALAIDASDFFHCYYNAVNIAGSTVAVPAVWYHAACVSDGSTLKLYVNGIEENMSVISTDIAETTDITIGGRSFTKPESIFLGTIDEVRVSNIARSASEIKAAASRRPSAIYTSPVIDFASPIVSWNPLTWSEHGVTTGDGETVKDSTALVAQWDFNSTSGTSAISGGSCSTTCNATLNNFASTGSQDAGTSTGWTADNKRWGAGALMFSSVATADSVSLANPGSNVLDPNSDDLTIEMWIKTNEVSGEIFSNNSGNGTSCTSNGYRLGINGSGFPIFNLDTNGATAGCDGLISSSSKPINDGSWHHVVVTVTRGTAANLYVDGILTGSDTTITSYAAITPTGTIYMGGSAGGYGGIIDSTRFYSRALSLSEIMSNYQSNNLELQTRVGSTTNPNDGTWGAWESTSGETAIDNLDNPLDYATPSASLYTGALVATSAATFPVIEGSKSLKVQTGKVVENSNIVGLWHLDETGGSGAYIRDSSSYGNHGTPADAAIIAGVTDKARLFSDTANSKINLGIPSSLDFTGTQPFTMEAWVKMTTIGDLGGIVGKRAPQGVGTNSQYSFHVTDTGEIELTVYGFTGSHVIQQTSTETLQVGTWTHVAAVYDGGTTTAAIKLYINGALAPSTGASAGTYTGMISGIYSVLIGRPNTTSNESLQGALDEVVIYNIAISAEEIAEGYRLGRDHVVTKTISSTDLSGKTSIPFYIAADRPGSYLSATIGESAYANYLPDASTIGLWHLDEESGTDAYIQDSSGNGNHGTPIGDSLTTDGKIGKGRALDGVSDRVNVGDATNTAALTVSAWIYPTTNSDGIITKGTSRGTSASRDWDLYGNGTDLIWAGLSTGATRWTAQATYPSLNQWHHVVATWDGTTTANGVKLYIDSVLVSVDTATATDIADRFDVAIGGSGTFTFTGSLDEARIDSVVRTPTEIREAYEIGLRTHPITIDFHSAISHSDPLSTSSDLTFTLMATPSGTTNAGDNIYPGDKIIVRENYDGTEYIAQGTVNTVNSSTGATTVSSWDGSSTFPSGGFTPSATVFKWQREYWNIDGEVQDSSLNAITNLNLQITNGNEGRTIWLDDLRSNSGYLTTPTGSTITSAVGSHYFQYRAVLSSFDEVHSATLSAVTIDYVPNVAPNTPTLDSPADTATNQSLTPTLLTTATDTESDYLRYKIELCTDLAMTLNCQTFDQTLNQAGWSGQNAQTSTAYTSGTQATYAIQTPLTAATTYYWRSYAIDPAGYNGWSGTQTPHSFTTSNGPSAPTTPYTEGLANPTGITDVTPEFSAIHNDPDGDSANKYQIQVNTASDFSGTIMWDSGETSMTTTADGVRSPDFSYAGTAITMNGTTYYWRIRFTDIGGAQGAWSATQNFTMNSAPDAPTLDSPANGATDQPTLTALKTTGTDTNADYLRYKIEVCTNLAMTTACQTFDQTSSQTGWSGQDAETSTAYASGTQATYTIQSTLLPATLYYWRSYSIDPSGSNTWSNTQAPPHSFTTSNAPDTATDCRIQENAFDTGATIVWTDASAVEDRYEIQRSVDGGGFSVLATNLAANTTSYLDSTAIQSHTYQYRVAPYFTTGPVYGAWCTTNVLSLSPSIFQFSGLNFNGIKLN